MSRGSVVAGKSLIKAPVSSSSLKVATSVSTASSPPASMPVKKPVSLVVPQITVAEDKETPIAATEQSKQEKQKKQMSSTDEEKMRRIKELKKKKREEKQIEEMERQLLKESKKMDMEKKNIQIDNQLSTFLASLLSLEAGILNCDLDHRQYHPLTLCFLDVLNIRFQGGGKRKECSLEEA